MYWVSKIRNAVGYAAADHADRRNIEVDDIRVSTDSEIDDDYEPPHDPYFSGYLNINKIKRRLAAQPEFNALPERDKRKAIEYFEWCIEKLTDDDTGLALQRELAKVAGEFSTKFVDMVNTRHTNRIISCGDQFSRKGRERCALIRRSLRGTDPKKGYPPEEGRDCLSWAWQTVAYFALPIFSQLRVISGAILFYGQYQGEFPVHKPVTHDGNFTGNFSDGMSVPSQNDEHLQLYEYAALIQYWSTFLSFAPVLFLHSPPQFRECCRGYAELNTNELAALNCFIAAVDHLCKGESSSSIENLRYKFGMESYKKRTAASASFDAKRMAFSVFRESIAYPGNLVLSGLSGISLAGGQYFGNQLLMWAGLFAMAQAVCDGGQGWNEAKSAEDKLREIVECLSNLNIMREDLTGKERNFSGLRSGVNSTARAFQGRQKIYQTRERLFGIFRIVKSVCGGSIGLALFVFGSLQVATGKKPTVWALLCSLINTEISGNYYVNAFVKMVLRNEEKKLKKELFRNSEFSRLADEKEELAHKQASAMTGRFIDYEHIFQNEKIGHKVSRKFAYNDNEFILLDVLADFILEDMHEAGKPSVLESELVKWLGESWGVSESMIKATLRACSDKAPKFQKDQLKQGLAGLLNITLPLGIDRSEKRIKPSLVVLSKMSLLDVEEADRSKGFNKVIEDFKRQAMTWFENNGEELMLGLKNAEEFIASVLHVFERSTAPEILTDRWIRFAKLVAVAEVLDADRVIALQGVWAAEFKDFKLPEAESPALLNSFAEFKNILKGYMETSVFVRRTQLDYLKQLTKNDFMQKLLLRQPDRVREVAGRRADSKEKLLVRGIALLYDRVDMYQPVPMNIPSSPRSEDRGDERATTATRVPAIVQVESSADLDFGDSQKRRVRRGKPRTRAGSGNLDGNDSDNRPHKSQGSSASTQKTSTSAQKSSARTTDENVLIESVDNEVVVSVSSTDSESKSRTTHVVLPRPFGIEEV